MSLGVSDIVFYGALYTLFYIGILIYLYMTITFYIITKVDFAFCIIYVFGSVGGNVYDI